MTRLMYLICLLAAMSLACGAVAAPVAMATPIHTNSEQVFTSPVPPKIKPNNAPKSDIPYQTRVTAQTLNIRVGPGHQHEIVSHVWLMRGEQITVYECFGGWAKIGGGRFVNSHYLETRCP